jgi:hypothetical protein
MCRGFEPTLLKESIVGASRAADQISIAQHIFKPIPVIKSNSTDCDPLKFLLESTNKIYYLVTNRAVDNGTMGDSGVRLKEYVGVMENLHARTEEDETFRFFHPS